MRLIVGMTGATGAPLGVRLLEVLRNLADVETHLVMSRWARTTIELETAYSVREVGKLADVVYGPGDQAAAISSGSFLTAGMVIVPCSMKTLAVRNDPDDIAAAWSPGPYTTSASLPTSRTL